MLLKWYMPEPTPLPYSLTHYVITLVGSQFSGEPLDSDMQNSVCMQYEGQKIAACQHTWVMKRGCDDNQLEIKGVCSKAPYQ
jgi:hypothetical protein